VGKLLIYDISHRIGGYLGLEPEGAYLHAGTKVGAKALGLNTRAEFVPMTALPTPLQRLSGAQAEDILCIYARVLKRIHDAGVVRGST
jgi:hypothetical protein